jgi:predicted ATP-binding protein involved in virulence
MSDNLYITGIQSDDHPYVKLDNINISLPSGENKNIIITGRNGCGKSTLLRSIKGGILQKQKNGNVANQIFQFKQTILKFKGELESLEVGSPAYLEKLRNINGHYPAVIDLGGFINIGYSNEEDFKNDQNILAYFEAKRFTNLSKPQHISAPKIAKEPIGQHDAGKTFIHHLVNRRSQLAFANEDNDDFEAQKIRQWFENLNLLFSQLFEKKVSLKFLRDQLDFTLETEKGEIIDMKTLSDGYSAIVSMVTEIIIRMEAISFGRLDIGGIVLIDEVETHLHVSLQRQILPFLTTMFPEIQFIVTTHSPFVLSSIDNAIIFDMESGETIDQEQVLWAYSYEALVEGFFEVEKFSNVLKAKIQEYKGLVELTEPDREQRTTLRKLKKELASVPTYKNAAIERELKILNLK